MGKRNYLIEGVSGTGKSSVCYALRERGYQTIDGDIELAYQGDPETGERTKSFTHEHHIWDINKVRNIVESKEVERTFFCGGSRNYAKFIDLFDGVFVLDIDVATLNTRLDSRGSGAWGNKKSERDLILRLHETKADIPKKGILIDATQSLEQVVNEILTFSGE